MAAFLSRIPILAGLAVLALGALSSPARAQHASLSLQQHGRHGSIGVHVGRHPVAAGHHAVAPAARGRWTTVANPGHHQTRNTHVRVSGHWRT